MKKEIKLVFEDGLILETERGITVAKVLEKLPDSNQIIALRINGRAVSTDYEIMDNASIKYISINDRTGRKIYTKGLQFMYIYAVNQLYGDKAVVNIKHSLDKAIYTELTINNSSVNNETVKRIKSKMLEIVNDNLPINKISSTREDAINYFERLNEQEKVLNYRYMTADYVSLYELDDMYNYFYYLMPASTGILSRFDLTYIGHNGIVLSYPIDGKIPAYVPTIKVFESFKDYENKFGSLGVRYASELNQIVTEGKIRDLIQMNELIYDESIDAIANKVANSKTIKAIFISGPSSSGKTTTSKKISLFLKSKGIDSLVISTDDYYVNRVDSPLDENGEYDYEVVDAIDYKLFSGHITKLLKGEEIVPPTFNFITGEKEFKRKPIFLHKNQVIIVEGLHAINEKLNGVIDHKKKLKIYISPFTPIGLDRHNHISTTDIRFLRRTVRDYNTRGYSANATLERWFKMRKSEEKNVYPYQRESDVIINTSFLYEIGVLRTYAEPLLYSIKADSPYYEEAIRILNFMKGFMNIPADDIPATSVLREFIGKSYFE